MPSKIISKYANLIFDCDCEFPIKEGKPVTCFDSHDPNFSVNSNCKQTWDDLEKYQQGVFQLELPSGQAGCSRLKPRNLEHIGALGSVLRPGCLECIYGDSKIAIRKNNHVKFFDNMKMRDIYKRFQEKNPLHNKRILSCEENTLDIVENEIEEVFYKGEQDVYQIELKISPWYIKKYRKNQLECTLNHKFLTNNRGWVELKNLIPGERILSLNHFKEIEKQDIKNQKDERSFRHICFVNYEYKCVFCDWKEGSLDVNRLEGNRKTNNHPDNLCFLCPNHHRLYSEKKITKEEIIEKRQKYKLLLNRSIYWPEFLGYKFIGRKDTYDIAVKSPNNNYIADSFIVHNSKLEDGISIKDHYIKRKNGDEEISPYHPVVDEVLKDTYGCMIYQENAMKLVVEVAGFNPQEADSLRKAIGKKIPEEMSKSKKVFYKKAKAKGILNDRQIEEVFGWIEKSQRYSFNKCLAGNTIISSPSNRLKTVRDLYNILYYKVDRSDRARVIRKTWKEEGYIGWGLSLNENEELVKNKIIDIKPAGRQEVSRVTLRDGNYFEATHNHKLPTNNGEKTVGQLLPSDKVYIKRINSQQAILVGLESVLLIGTTDTYDVSMQEPYHNLCVNGGIVVNNSHAISYGLLGFISAYIKTHFPLQFYTAWLKNEKTEAYHNLIKEAKLFSHTNTYTPDLRDLEKDFHIKNKAIRFGLTNVKNVGNKDYEKLVDIKDNSPAYTTDSKPKWPTILFNVLENINSRAAESLIRVGALDYLKIDRQRMLIEFNECKKLFKSAEKEKEYLLENLLSETSVCDILKKVLVKASSSRKKKIQKVLDYLENPISPLKDTVDSILFAEKELLGVNITNHESDNLPSAIETHSCLDVENGCGDHVVLKVKIDKVKTHIDKNGNEMAFIEISDNSCMLKSVMFWQTWAEFKYLISEGALLFVSGKKLKSFVIERVYAN